MKSKWDWCLPDVVIFCIWAHLNGIIEMQIIILPLVFICYKTTTWNIGKLRHKHFCHIKTFWQTSSFFFFMYLCICFSYCFWEHFINSWSISFKTAFELGRLVSLAEHCFCVSKNQCMYEWPNAYTRANFYNRR